MSVDDHQSSLSPHENPNCSASPHAEPSLSHAAAVTSGLHTPVSLPVSNLQFSSPVHGSITHSQGVLGYRFPSPPPPRLSMYCPPVTWPTSQPVYGTSGYPYQSYEYRSTSQQPPQPSTVFPDAAVPFPQPLVQPQSFAHAHQSLPTTNVWSLNVTNYIATTLSSVDYYLS